MTQEEKAKRYDETLEQLRGLIEGTREDKCAIVEEDIINIFPELKESEEEKLRKVLVGFFKSYKEQGTCGAETFNGIPTDKILTWLEKQDESITIKKGKNYLCAKTHKYAGVEWIKGTKYYASDNYTLLNQVCEYYCPEYSKEEHNNLFEEVKYDGCFEKQDEQKETLCDKCKKAQPSHSCQDITALGRCYIAIDYNGAADKKCEQCDIARLGICDAAWCSDYERADEREVIFKKI